MTSHFDAVQITERASYFPRRPNVSPSLRLRVTAANRSLLRWMRAMELAAWQEADESPRRAMQLFHD